MPKTLRLDAAVARAYALIAEDAPEIIGGWMALYVDRIEVSPEVASWITGRSAKAIRDACGAGDLAHRGRRKRWVILRDLAAWSGVPIGADALARMLRQAADTASRYDFFRDAPLPLTMEDTDEREWARPPKAAGQVALLDRMLAIGAKTHLYGERGH